MNQEITAEILLSAYANGYFPMAESKEANELYWFHPEMRGILPLENFHIPKSLAKLYRKGDYHFTIDQDFAAVIRACADRKDTWINDDIVELYCQLHVMGYAHSVECWLPHKNCHPGLDPGSQATRADNIFGLRSPLGGGDDKEYSLIGGLYGVSLGGAFFGESMFSRAENASKLALVFLVERLNECGYALLDAQYVNDHLKQFGIIEIPRNDYLMRLESALTLKPTPLSL